MPEPLYSPEHPERQDTADKRPINFLPDENHRKPRRGRACLILLLLLFVIWSGRRIVHRVIPASYPNDPAQYDEATGVPKPQGILRRLGNAVLGVEATLAGQKNDRINILLMGQGGPGHDGPYLTDTIILASIKPSTGQVGMLSIPRDLGVEIPGHGWYKVNHANAFGEADAPERGGELAVKVMEKTFALDIPYYVRVDFQAFERIIDAVDGVKINVARSFMDTEYPAPNSEFQTVQFEKGIQTMTGAQALTYARSRHGNNGEGSDFARAKRQQQVLMALKEKVLSFQTLTSPARVNAIIKSLGEHVTTDMNFGDIILLLKLAREMPAPNIITMVLDIGDKGLLDEGYTEDGAYILQPKTGNFGEIRLLVENIFAEKPNISAAAPPQDIPRLTPAVIEIQNGTWRAGLAARVQQTLRYQRITAAAIGNTAMRPQAASGIYAVSNSAPGDVLEALKTALKIPIKRNIPAGEAATSTADILVILGEDYQE